MPRLWSRCPLLSGYADGLSYIELMYATKLLTYAVNENCVDWANAQLAAGRI